MTSLPPPSSPIKRTTGPSNTIIHQSQCPEHADPPDALSEGAAAPGCPDVAGEEAAGGVRQAG
ncbi:hypothetical protein J4Q44_G00349890 [Coregonus suidteri]|uniref:Uncharacterized protein n=1 Tax=Coregonus suidteri TaxID=861788 RepID=A0AAN8KG83_9TELE